MNKQSVVTMIGACTILLANQAPVLATSSHPCLNGKPLSTHQQLQYAPPANIETQQGIAFRLSGLIVETMPTQTLAKARSQEAETFLSDPTIIKTVFITKKKKRDRYGRASVFVSKPLHTQILETPQVEVLQEALLQQGLARVDPTTIASACADRLLKFETQARDEKAGLWKHPLYQIKEASTLKISAVVSSYQIVHGTVKSVSRNAGGTSYLNFGRNWQTDFTVTLSKKNLAAWEEQNKSLDELVNAHIYVRGWIEDRGGPLIRVLRPQQLWAKSHLD